MFHLISLNVKSSNGFTGARSGQCYMVRSEGIKGASESKSHGFGLGHVICSLINRFLDVVLGT